MSKATLSCASSHAPPLTATRRTSFREVQDDGQPSMFCLSNVRHDSQVNMHDRELIESKIVTPAPVLTASSPDHPEHAPSKNCQLTIQSINCPLRPIVMGSVSEIAALSSVMDHHEISLKVQVDGSLSDGVTSLNERLTRLWNTKITTLLLIYDYHFTSSMLKVIQQLSEYLRHVEILVVQVRILGMEMRFVFDVGPRAGDDFPSTVLIEQYIMLLHFPLNKIEGHGDFSNYLTSIFTDDQKRFQEAMIMLPPDIDSRVTREMSPPLRMFVNELRYFYRQLPDNALKYGWQHNSLYGGRLNPRDCLFHFASKLSLCVDDALYQPCPNNTVTRVLDIQGLCFFKNLPVQTKLKRAIQQYPGERICELFSMNQNTTFDALVSLTLSDMSYTDTALFLNGTQFPRLKVLKLCHFPQKSTLVHLRNFHHHLDVLSFSSYDAQFCWQPSSVRIKTLHVHHSHVNRDVRKVMAVCNNISIKENSLFLNVIDSDIRNATSLHLSGTMIRPELENEFHHVVHLTLEDCSIVLCGFQAPQLRSLKLTRCKMQLKGEFPMLKTLECHESEWSDANGAMRLVINEMDEKDDGHPLRQILHPDNLMKPFRCPQLENFVMIDTKNADGLLFDAYFAPLLKTLVIDSIKTKMSLPCIPHKNDPQCYFPALTHLVLKCDASSFTQYPYLIAHLRMAWVDVLVIHGVSYIPRFYACTFLCRQAFLYLECSFQEPLQQRAAISLTLTRMQMPRVEFLQINGESCVLMMDDKNDGLLVPLTLKNERDTAAAIAHLPQERDGSPPEKDVEEDVEGRPKPPRLNDALHMNERPLIVEHNSHLAPLHLEERKMPPLKFAQAEVKGNGEKLHEEDKREKGKPMAVLSPSLPLALHGLKRLSLRSEVPLYQV